MGLLTCAAIALLATPSSAVSKPGYTVFPGSHMVELSLRGSHGYAITVGRFDPRGIQLYVSKGTSVVIYVLRRSHSSGDGIEAEFPGVGRISVRFHPTGAAHTKPGFFNRCEGGQTIEQKGYFQGVIRIRGERGYTTARARRAPGQVVTQLREVCKRSMFDPGEPSPEESKTRLFAISRSGGRAVAFSAVTLGFLTDSLTYFSGATGERREGMAIYREVFVRAPERDLSVSGPGDYPPTAVATPPWPFHGSASFERRHGGSNRWLGSLAADLPGIGRVELAGPEFAAKLCRDSGCRPVRARPALGLRALPLPPGR